MAADADTIVDKVRDILDRFLDELGARLFPPELEPVPAEAPARPRRRRRR